MTPTARPTQPATLPSASAASPAPAASPTPAASSFDAAKLTIRLDPVVAGLNAPLAVVNAGDGSGRLFVVEQPGLIRIVRDGVLEDQPFLDISRRITSGGERGLLGLAFSPDFPADPRLYVDYTDLNGNSVIASFRVPVATPNQADPSSERILLHSTSRSPTTTAAGSRSARTVTCTSRSATAARGGDPQGNGAEAQHRCSARSCGSTSTRRRRRPGLHDPARQRRSPTRRAPARRSGPTACAIPWRFSFDRQTGDLWIGDVGQDAWEEVDVIRASDPPNVAPNFGWNIMEGRHCFRTRPLRPGRAHLPVAEYGHDLGCSIIGGYVGRNPAEPTLFGGYLYGDDCSGNIWVLDAARPESGTPRLVLDSGHAISSFGEDAEGRLYLTDLSDGTLYRVVAVP